ncbi:MAG: isoleucine--tRNA ligase [Chloroflexi bacterium B3_Chlor]|nr:MAG: isoleucine--tRNA ligase [Chloroflexi bacterium B3_Chlor]
MFREVPSKVDFPALERRILKWWAETDAFHKLVEKNKGKKRWSFIDGPITANNPMGVHHAWGRTYKDLFHRYKAMQGHEMRYQNGFDGQGLWIEVEVERELGFTSKRDIEKHGIAPFVEKCKERVQKFSAVQTQQSIRLGYWMDWDNSYHTMSDENNYTIWLFLKRCHERGWIYKGRDVLPWCPRCSTAISEHEIVTEGYQELTHPAVTLFLPLVGRPGESLLVWTTTPWTLTSNVAAAVHPDAPYVKAKQGDSYLYLAREALPILQGRYEVVEELRGVDMDGWTYHGPFDDLPAQHGVEHRVILWNEVSETEGTGIVHIAPGCGKEDLELGKEYDLPAIAPLDEFGTFVEGFEWLSGLNVADSAEPIFEDLRKKGLLYRVDDYTHRYPVCWRCQSELVFRLVDEWFVSMDELRYQIMDVVRQIRWIPEFGMDRELDWLRNMDDWMISKKRYWGLALPIYDCACGHFEVIGSEVELKQRAIEGWEEFEGHSPHRPWIDAVKIRCPECGNLVSRIADVGNPWLDAGIVALSTLNYRHNREYWEKWYPADFISECFPGQFRNWFYALLAESTAMENRPPFLTVFGYALAKDEHGEEMHKSSGNVIWFDDAAEAMGVDVMRWMYCAHNPRVSLNFGYGPADEVRRRFLIPLWNIYSFFTTYANIDGWTPQRMGTTPVQAPRSNVLDRWILSRLQVLIKEVVERLDDYDAAAAARSMEAFVDDLSNWYVRRSRRRFWKSEQDEDKNMAYWTLYGCLVTLVRLMAPFIPFVTEEMYQNLVRSVDADAAESVHHCDFPVADLALVDEKLMADMDLATKVASLGRSARGLAGIRLRQPLALAVVAGPFAEQRDPLGPLAELVLDELNIKELRFTSEPGEVVSYVLRPDPGLLGPKHGPLLPKIQEAVATLDAADWARRLKAGEAMQVPVDGEIVQLLPEEVTVETRPQEGYEVSQEGSYIVGVRVTLTDELIQEGLARELVRRIQNLRKDADFRIEDKITTYYHGDAALTKVMRDHDEYISQETLSLEMVEGEWLEGAHTGEFQIDGMTITLQLVRVPAEGDSE